MHISRTVQQKVSKAKALFRFKHKKSRHHFPSSAKSTWRNDLGLLCNDSL